MPPSRREFLWIMGAAGATYGLRRAPEWVLDPQTLPDQGWTPGEESRRNSTCLVCPGRCGIQGRVVDGRLVRITGNTFHPLSQGGVCPRGVAGVQTLYHPDRIMTPLRRTGARGAGEWQEITRDDALDEIAERLRGARAEGHPERLALLAGYCAGSMQDLWRQFLRAFGSPNYVSDDYDDGTAALMELMHGIPRRPAYDLDESDFVLSFGAPLFEAWWSPLQAFVAFADAELPNGGRRRFVQVDTRFSLTAARAQEWVGVRPETHAALALGIAYVLIRDELFDADFVANHVRGFEDWRDERGRTQEGYRSLVLRHYRTEDVSEITGVPVARITSLARAFAASDRPVVICGNDVMHSADGLLAGLAIHSLNALTGSVNRAGGVLVGDDPPLAPLADPVLDHLSETALRRTPIAGDRPPFGSGSEATRFARAVTNAATPPEVLLLYLANPLASSDAPDAWATALARIPFLVSFSPFLDETTQHADLILPDLLPYERWQDGPTPSSYPYPVWGVSRPLVDPPTGATHTGDAILALASRMGGTVAQSVPYDSFEALLTARARGLFAAGRGMLFGDEFERRHLEAMERRGWWLAEYPEFDAFWQALVERGGWTDLYYDHADPARVAQTPSHRIELWPAGLGELADQRESPPNPYLDIRRGTTSAPDAYPLRLLPYRVSTLASGSLSLQPWLAEQPALFPDTQWEPWVEVSPETAQELGFDDHSMVWVVSPRGRYRARLRMFAGTARDNVCAPYGLRHPNGDAANPLQLLDGTIDALTGLPSWSSTFIRLERA